MAFNDLRIVRRLPRNYWFALAKRSATSASGVPRRIERPSLPQAFQTLQYLPDSNTVIAVQGNDRRMLQSRPEPNMTAEKLYELLKYLDTLDTRTNLQSSLEAVRNSLQSIVNQPAQSQHQANLADALMDLDTASSKLRGALSPSQAATLKGMGGEEFFEPSIAGTIRNAVQTNAMTPSVARDFVNDLVGRRATFLNTVRAGRQNLEKLGVKESTLEPGGADLAFLIPRELFKNDLGVFAKELEFINRLLRDFSEAITGHVEPVEMEQLSSSVPTVALLAKLGVVDAIGKVVKLFLDAWEKIERIRRIRGELAEVGIKKTGFDELSEQITTTVEKVVEESTELVLTNYNTDEHRKKELANAIRQDAYRLFGQIERGLTVEVRVEPKRDASDEDRKMLDALSNLSATLVFPQVAKEPMLLGTGEIIEGDLKAKYSKKTTTKTTTTTAVKEASKEGRGDGKG